MSGEEGTGGPDSWTADGPAVGRTPSARPTTAGTVSASARRTATAARPAPSPPPVLVPAAPAPTACPASSAARRAASAAAAAARSASRWVRARSGRTSSVESVSCGGVSSCGSASPAYRPVAASYPVATANPCISQVSRPKTAWMPRSSTARSVSRGRYGYWQ